MQGRRIADRPGVTHLIAATRRFSGRLGNQFAGAMTYFSLLSLVPILMVGFAVTGIVLRNNQELLAALITREIVLMPADIADRVTPLIDSIAADPFGIGITGLLIAIYSGIGWMRNLRKAITVLWRPTLREKPADTYNIAITALRDLGSLTGLTAVVVLSLALSTTGSWFATQTLDWLGLGTHPWMAPVITLLALLIAIATDVMIFLWTYTVLPGKELRASFAARLRGSIVAAITFEIFKYTIVVLVPTHTSNSPTTAIFGPIIGMLFFLHLLSQMILFIAAWIATAEGHGEAP